MWTAALCLLKQQVGGGDGWDRAVYRLQLSFLPRTAPPHPSSAHPGSARQWGSVECNKNTRFQVLQGRGKDRAGPRAKVSPPSAKL